MSVNSMSVIFKYGFLNWLLAKLIRRFGNVRLVRERCSSRGSDDGYIDQCTNKNDLELINAHNRSS